MPTLPERIRSLAEADAGELPLISVYLDMRPEATGQKPELREGQTFVRDRLRELRRTLGVRGPDVDSFEADAERITAFAHEERDATTEGLAIFACHGIGLFETVEAQTPFENQVSMGPAADLYQLARLDETYETALVALVDTNTARLFAYRRGRLLERGGPDDDPVHYRKRQTGGWSQARYQRHIDGHRKEFAEEIARAIGQAVERERASHIILAGSDVALRWLDEALPKELPEQVTSLIRDRLRIDMRADLNDVTAEIEPVLREVEQRSGEDAVRRVVAEVRRGGLGVTGLEWVRRALELGQVDELVIDDNAELDDEARAGLVRQAALTSAAVEVVGGDERHTALADGVGAILRWRE